MAEMCRDHCDSSLISQSLGDGFGFLKALEHSLIGGERRKRLPQVEQSIDGLLEDVWARRETLKGDQAVLEGRYRLLVRRALEGLDARLAKIPYSQAPRFTPEGMMCQPLRLLGQSIPVQLFYRHDDPGMQGTPSLLEETSVGHLVGERVLECIREIRREARLVEKLGRLEVVEPRSQVLISALANREEECERDVFAND